MNDLSEQCSTPPPLREIAARRRDIVAELLLQRFAARFQEVFDQLRSSFPADTLRQANVRPDKLASATALRADLKWLRKARNIQASLRADSYVHLSSQQTTLDRRFKQRPTEKESIGRMAAMLIAPTQLQRQIQLRTAIGKLTDLEMMYGQFVRLMVLDSGTTTYRVATAISENIHTPDEERKLSELRILTNFVKLGEVFSDYQNSPDLILLGGKLRKDTGAVIGHLAERCLEAWGLSHAPADISIIGTTHVTGEGFFCSDHEEESAIKKRLLCCARIKCVVADAEKILQGRGARAWVFAKLADVQFVITNPRMRHPQETGKDERTRQDFLRKAEEKNVLVLAEPESPGDDCVVGID